MSFLLTSEERERFASWLEREAETNTALIEQLEKLGPAGTAIVAKEKVERQAALVIARKLRSIEDMSIGGIPE